MPSLSIITAFGNRFSKAFRANDAKTLTALVNAFCAGADVAWSLRSVNPAGSADGSTWCLVLSGTTFVNVPFPNAEYNLSSLRAAFRVVGDAQGEIQAALEQCATELDAAGYDQTNETIVAGAGSGQVWLVGLLGSAE